ncbi:MAG: hypothetical protein HOV81_11995 [Kofleriaceae bacterium]|nr:hypothetical protein [Kofleriaceae bacterium]
MAPLNISVIDGDATLQKTQDNINGESLVGGARVLLRGNESVDGVREVVAATTGDLHVDLIAHARDGELHVGQWLISALETEAAGILQTAGGRIKSIRLLGCFTARGKGRAAMQHLKDLGYPKVYGTRRILGSRHFGPNGLLDDALALELGTLPPEPLSALVNWDTAFGSMRQVPNVDLGSLVAETTVDAARDVSKYLGPEPWLLREVPDSQQRLSELLANIQDVREEPGLLQLPDRELLYPAATGRVHRVTSLFGGRWIRIYPASHPGGVIVRPMAPLPL